MQGYTRIRLCPMVLGLCCCGDRFAHLGAAGKGLELILFVGEVVSLGCGSFERFPGLIVQICGTGLIRLPLGWP